MSNNCRIGTIHKNCRKVSPCMKDGLCYTKDGKIPTSILSNPLILDKLNSDCSNDMYQSQGTCPKDCQWLGGKTNRCQTKKRMRKNTDSRLFSVDEIRSLNIAKQQPKLKGFIKNPRAKIKMTVKKPKNEFQDCYKFKNEDKLWRNEGGKKGRKFVRTEKEMCERHGYRYTKGVDNPDSCGKCWCCKNMAGGGGYNKIINPLSGRKVNINSSLGKTIIKHYLNYFN